VHDGRSQPDSAPPPNAGVPAADTPDFEVAIIGAGFGGMGAAIQLRRMGIDSILMLDRASDVGGTWHLNTYPGIAVDIPSVTYSFSFELNAEWTRTYAPGHELAAYARKVADKHDLRRHIRFGANVEQVVYDEARKLWTVSVEGQPNVTARILVCATGYLSRPKLPEIPGIESFAGKVIHTAAWDHDYALKGKRAAVIGTGATAVQLIPEVAKELEALHVYQRTATWVGPKPDTKIAPVLRAIYRALPLAQRIRRFFNASFIEFLTVAAILNFRIFPWMTWIAERACRLHMARQVPDRELRQKLTPRYHFGCKRPTFSNTYYRAFTRPNVELITEPIARIEADGIVTADGTRRPIDTLLLATGFKVWERDTFHSILGKGGVELRDQWEQTRYQSYEGITIPGFPNLFYLPSPYSYTGLSYFFTLEGQMKHIARCLGQMRVEGANSFEVLPEAQARYIAAMRARAPRTVFLQSSCGGANSYYFDRHGDPSLVRPMSAFEGLLRHRFFPLRNYRFE
jgi:cation diffusion facilitator CzcD-associated flavoprotein CzcO